MLILIHVIIALSSVIYAGLSFFSPSQKKLNVSYALIALTITTGTYLVVSTHSPMLQSCMTGLAYLAVVLLETFAVRTRLAKATNR